MTAKILKKSIDLLTYKNKGTTMTYFNMVVLDNDGQLHQMRSYQKSKFLQMKIGLTFKFSNLAKKSDGFWMTSTCTFRYTKPIEVECEHEVPLLQEEEPQPGQKRSIRACLDTNVRSTVKVKVVEVSPVKMCKEGTLPVRVLEVKDKSASAKLFLFSDKATTAFRRHDLIEVSSVYTKKHNATTTLCASRESTLQFLPEDNEIDIVPQDAEFFSTDLDFAGEEKVEITIPEFCRVSVYPYCTKEGCRAKGFVDGACTICKNEDGVLTCRAEVMFNTNKSDELKKAVLFREDLEKVMKQKIVNVDEDDIIMLLVSLLPLKFTATIAAGNKFKNIS